MPGSADVSIHMNIVVARRSGWYGKFVGIELLCNGKVVGTLRENEEITLQLESQDLPASLEVKMQSLLVEHGVQVDRLIPGLYLECGTGFSLWTLLVPSELQGLLPRANGLYIQTVRR
jgi:hypothetical protein